METFKNIADYIQVLIRYVLSGIITVMSLAYLDSSIHVTLISYLKMSPWIVAGIAGTFGILTYAVHQALFDKIFYSLMIGLYMSRNKLPDDLEKEIKLFEGGRRKPCAKKENGLMNFLRFSTRFGLFSQTYLRRASSSDMVGAIQREMEKKLALLNFLYCTVYSLIFSALYVSKSAVSETTKIATTQNTNAFYIAGSVVLAVALIFDYRITRRELWTVTYFFQSLPTYHFKISVPKPEAEIQTLFIRGSFDNYQEMHAMKAEVGSFTLERKSADRTVYYQIFLDDTGKLAEGIISSCDCADTNREGYYVKKI